MKQLIKPDEEIVKTFNAIWNNTYDGRKVQIFDGEDAIDISDYIEDLRGLSAKDEDIHNDTSLKSFLDKINTVYHTRVNSVDKIVDQLKQNGISSKEELKTRIQNGDDCFDLFVKLCRQATGKYTYSFASKVFNFLDSKNYPIIDSYVATLLDTYEYDGKIPKTQWGKYNDYRKNYEAFLKNFGLEEFKFKEVDVFLWCYGKVLEKYWEEQGVLKFSSVSFKA